MLDERFMDAALDEARGAGHRGEVPVGAVVVVDQEIVARGANCPIATHDPSAHAEMVAVRAAARRFGNYRLPDATVYVTLEPCVMCLGLLVHARIARLVYGAKEPKTGAVESRIRLLEEAVHNHVIEVAAGVRADESAALVRGFFEARR